jgi:alpha-D-ribose 1-methylphosphonate 5-triphosphate synthase subunit PhnG
METEVEFTNFLGSRVYLGFLKARLKSRFQEVAIHQFRAKNATRVAFFTLSRVFR